MDKLTHQKVLELVKAGLPCSMVHMHTALMVPGSIDSQVSLSDAKTPGFKAFYTNAGVIVYHKGTYSLVPLANVKNVVLGKASEEETSKKGSH